MTVQNSESPSPAPPDEFDRRLRRISRRGFAVGGAVALAGFGGWRWLVSRSEDSGIIWPLRRVLEFNEGLARATFRESGLSPTFPVARARMPRVNGWIGIDPAIDAAAWRLRVVGPAGERSFSLPVIKALPRVEMTTELRCIEGWSEVVRWAGARLGDLAALSGLATRSGRAPDQRERPVDLFGYAALETPGADYYVGLDMASALHPQTLLCYEMGGQSLTPAHGAPLRLVIPVKYGIKSLKQIGTIRFTDHRPPDYWAERGYDWYAGH
ncbi:MAG: molybdopterin-dependent oxidoreductase [Planctomycetaceae bacterium]|jgi:DMSO/TMAO reductase YedYZ molybdopterin-dependent catalytic subunit|nr:molybdopterin-dependent oxidoreductase [Planctomycetaceae bacterium]